MRAQNLGAVQGQPLVKLWGLILTHSQSEAEEIARREGIQDPEKFRERVRSLLKTPIQTGWPDIPSVDFRTIEARAVSERRNVALVMSKVYAERPDLALVCIDIDTQDAKALEFADFCGSVGADVYKTGRGLHIWGQVRGGAAGLLTKPELVIVEGVAYQGPADVFGNVRKYVVVPVAGTPRGEECEWLWYGGRNVKGRGLRLTLGGFLARLEVLPLLEIATLSKAETHETGGSSEGIWTQLFGEGWRSARLEDIADCLRAAPFGSRNVTLYNAAVLAGYRGWGLEEVANVLGAAARAVFRLGDPEASGGTYRGALDTICRAHAIGQQMRAQHDRGAPPVQIRRPDGQPQQTGDPPTVKAHAAYRMLAETGALLHRTEGEAFVLHAGNAVELQHLAAYCMGAFNVLIRPGEEKLLQTQATVHLKKAAEVLGKVLILGDLVKSYRGHEFFACTFSRLDTGTQLLELEREADAKRVREVLEGCATKGMLSQEEATELAETYKTWPGELRYGIAARCEEVGGRLGVRLYGFPVHKLPQGVYMPREQELRRRVPYVRFLEWLAATVAFGGVDPREFAGPARAVLRGEPFSCTATDWQALPRSELARFLAELGKYHSNRLYVAYVTGKGPEWNAPFLPGDILRVRSILLLNATAIRTAHTIVTGPPGAGKTELVKRLCLIANGIAAGISPDPRMDVVQLAERLYRLIVQDEAQPLKGEVQARVKSAVTGFAQISRKYFTDTEARGETPRELSFLQAAANPPYIDPESERRTIVFTVEPPKERKPDTVLTAERERECVTDAFSLAMLRAIAAAADSIELPEWARDESHASHAQGFVALVRAFGIPEELAQQVWQEARGKAVPLALGIWRDIVELTESEREFREFMSHWHTPTEIALELRRRGVHRDRTTDAVAQEIGRNRTLVAAKLRGLGWLLEFKEVRGVYKYRLTRLEAKG